LIDRLADIGVPERVLALDVRSRELVTNLVDTQMDDAQFRSRQRLGIRVGIDTINILNRHRFDQVDVAGKQCGNACAVRGDRREDDAVEIMLYLTPPCLVRLEYRLDARLMAFDHEWPRS